MHPLGKVPTQWSPNLAYAIGLLAADGSLSKDGRHIDFTSKDRGLVETFKKCLGINNKITKKVSGFTGEASAFRVQFGDVLFHRWLMELGLTPKKSLTIGALKVPDQHFFDFLRGNFDGDGTIYAYWDPRWHSSYMFYITFISASRNFLDWMQETINRLCGLTGHITALKDALGLRYAKRESLVLFRQMFYANNLPHLRRKYQKAQAIFKVDTKHNQDNARVVKLGNTQA